MLHRRETESPISVAARASTHLPQPPLLSAGIVAETPQALVAHEVTIVGSSHATAPKGPSHDARPHPSPRPHRPARHRRPAAATGAVAQTTPVPAHPRVNEVNKRIDNQQQRIDKGVANGTVTPQQAARDERRDAHIAQRESADEAKHNGHLTRAETRRLNRAENRNSRAIHRQRH
ncbi:hypothetical protein [Rhodanobacter soli]